MQYRVLQYTHQAWPTSSVIMHHKARFCGTSTATVVVLKVFMWLSRCKTTLRNKAHHYTVDLRRGNRSLNRSWINTQTDRHKSDRKHLGYVILETAVWVLTMTVFLTIGFQVVQTTRWRQTSGITQTLWWSGRVPGWWSRWR